MNLGNEYFPQCLGPHTPQLSAGKSLTFDPCVCLEMFVINTMRLHNICIHILAGSYISRGIPSVGTSGIPAIEMHDG